MNNSDLGVEQTGFLASVVQYLLKTLVYTPVLFIGFAFVTFPFSGVILVQSESEFAGIALLVLISWSIMFGQFEALDYFENEDDEEYTGIVSIAISIGTVIYYNSIMFVSLVSGLAASQAGLPVVATTFALLIPVGDVYAALKYDTGLVIWIFDASVWAGEIVTNAYDKIPAKKILSSMHRILGSTKDAVPPAIGDLSLNSIRRRHLR